MIDLPFTVKLRHMISKSSFVEYETVKLGNFALICMSELAIDQVSQEFVGRFRLDNYVDGKLM